MLNILSVVILEGSLARQRLYRDIFSAFGLKVLSVSSDGRYSFDTVATLKPNIFLCDKRILDEEGIDPVLWCCRVSPQTEVVLNMEFEAVLTRLSVIFERGIERGANERNYCRDRCLSLNVNSKDSCAVCNDVVYEIINKLGITGKSGGAHYICAAVTVMLGLSVPCEHVKVTKDVYPSVAKAFNKTEACVERGIRYCVESITEQEYLEELQTAVSQRRSGNEGKISNSKFLQLLCEYVRYKI